MCSSTDSSDLIINWAVPGLNADSVIEYEVMVLQYIQAQGSREVRSVDLSPPFNQWVDGLQTTVEQGVGEYQCIVAAMMFCVSSKFSFCGHPSYIY